MTLIDLIEESTTPNNNDNMAANRTELLTLAKAIHNLTNAINNLSKELQNLQVRAPIPTFSGGNQNPVMWLNDFNSACAANGWNVARKLQTVPAFLKGSAAIWYQKTAVAINAWAEAANANNFEYAFLIQFQAPLVDVWVAELDQRQQRSEESVDEYALSIQELYQRVNNDDFAFPDNLQARKFVSGLLPELYMAVKPFRDQTLTAAINRAKVCEFTLKHDARKLEDAEARRPAKKKKIIN